MLLRSCQGAGTGCDSELRRALLQRAAAGCDSKLRRRCCRVLLKQNCLAKSKTTLRATCVRSATRSGDLRRNVTTATCATLTVAAPGSSTPSNRCPGPPQLHLATASCAGAAHFYIAANTLQKQPAAAPCDGILQLYAGAACEVVVRLCRPSSYRCVTRAGLLTCCGKQCRARHFALPSAAADATCCRNLRNPLQQHQLDPAGPSGGFACFQGQTVVYVELCFVAGKLCCAFRRRNCLMLIQP